MLRRVFALGLLLSISMAMAALPATAAVPVVSNVHAEQRPGTKLVDITYDVEDLDGDMLTISVAVSDDAGNTYTVPARTFIDDPDTGEPSDVWRGSDGQGIPPGNGKKKSRKKIVWDAGADVPNFHISSCRVKVTASDMGMVLIPAGEFDMGDAFNEGGANELPVHAVYLDDFYMDVYEVTNAQYKEFVDATGHPAPVNWSGGTYPAGKGDHPVIFVSWFDAADYAAWAGKRLPTEAEWEKAARGGLVGKRYPWGDSISPADANYDLNIGGTTPVGNYPPNGYGLYDVAGNVWEWCNDWYSGTYYGSSPYENPQGPGDTGVRVLRGGGWGNYAFNLRVADRHYFDPTDANVAVGFRCAGLVTP
ncbi:formylglycine-generating enzyme family protein [Candidatus Poribacteria bacterium]